MAAPQLLTQLHPKLADVWEHSLPQFLLPDPAVVRMQHKNVIAHLKKLRWDFCGCDSCPHIFAAGEHSYCGGSFVVCEDCKENAEFEAYPDGEVSEYCWTAADANKFYERFRSASLRKSIVFP